MIDFKYKPDGETLRQFLLSDTFFRGLRGPVGSGKSVTCAVEVFKRGLTQKVAPTTGRRMSRWLVVRNTYAELRTTTIETWKSWFPEDVWGPIVMNPPPFKHHLQKGDLDLEVLFLALDRPEDVKKLLSLELTGAWINEAREVPKTIVDAVTSRVGRYPSMKDGGPSWYGVIADTNSPDEDHWWPIMAGEAPVPDHIPHEEAKLLVRPENWKFFCQPAGMFRIKDKDGSTVGYELNAARENGANITPTYYPTMIQGKSADWIKVYVLNELASLHDGKPIYPDFNRGLHVAKEEIQAIPGVPLIVGVDFGLTPSAVVMQVHRHRLLKLRELVCQDMGIVRFSELLRSELTSWFPDHLDRIRVHGDPSGDYRAQTDEQTPFQIMRRAGFKAVPAPTNDPSLRIDAVAGTLQKIVDQVPQMLIDPRCVNLIKAYDGGYHYKRMQVSGGNERYETVPNKNKFSHVADADQYGTAGAGFTRAILTGGQTQTARVARPQNLNPFDRHRRQDRFNGRSRLGM
jgi:hypothetical protein